MKAPNATVLMSVYNGARFLEEAIESILNQTMGDFEFLIIDDGSTDDSVRIIQTFSDRRIRLIQNNENIGLTRSLNIGLRLAKGQYIARMDADDISLPKRFQTQLKFLEINPEFALCGSWYETISNPPVIIRQPKSHEGIKLQLLFNNAIAHSTVMLRKDVILERNLFYDEKLVTAQDYDLWVRMIKDSKIANIDQVLVRYRIHNDQIGQKYIDQQKVAANNSRKKILKYFGVEISDVDFEIHQKIAKNEIDNSREYLDDVLLYFFKIICSNRESNFVREDALVSFLAKGWWEICQKHSHIGISIWKKYHSASLKKKVNLTFFQEFKFFIKCLTKYDIIKKHIIPKICKM